MAEPSTVFWGFVFVLTLIFFASLQIGIKKSQFQNKKLKTPKGKQCRSTAKS